MTAPSVAFAAVRQPSPEPSSTTPDELIGSVRALVRRGRVADARSLARTARSTSGLREAGQAAGAVIAVEHGRFPAAAERLQGLSRESALRLVPAELVAVELATDQSTGVATAEAILSSPAQLPPETWLDVARHAFARDELDLSRRALRRIGEGRMSVPNDVQAEAGWLERWIEQAGGHHPPAAAAQDQISVAVLDYKLPDYRRTSANVGDYIQTLASLGHLLRHQGLRLNGDPRLVARLTELQSRVLAQRRLRGAEREITVVAVNRDASSLDSVPGGTWMLAFGWYMHGWFRVRYDFPFQPRLRPLFISFHVNRPELLSDEGLSYLRRHSPIGCRDWDTVRRLLDLGIPAFFSGCLTSTVDLLFADGAPPPAPDAPVALVDLPPGAESASGRTATRLSHASIEIREAALPDNLERAVQALEGYRREFSRVVTSRLHCYLPARALGVDVEFRPGRHDDPRFDGLIGIDEEAFAAMQHGIGSKLEAVLSSILRGDDEETVRAIWSEVCAPDVEAAQARSM
jgi:hypothetical protein